MSTDNVSHQLPSNMVARELGEVNIRRIGPTVEVQFTILMAPDGAEAEGWQTGVALDASESMKRAFGRAFTGTIPDKVLKEYARQGWFREQHLDGRVVRAFEPEAYHDAQERGYIQRLPNLVQALARDFIAYLADNLDADGGTTVVYWACGDGSEYEVLGDFTGAQCRTLDIAGPRGAPFGLGTVLQPAVEYFVERFKDAQRGMYVFLTDGRLDDLEAVKDYTRQLAREIARGKRHTVKCVLIGVGSEIDEEQMEQLDDLDTGTDVDIWDHKIAAEMRSLMEIFAEVVSENQIVAPSARLYDATGEVVKTFADGLPAKVTFTMSAASPWFDLEVEGTRIRQSVAWRRAK